MGGLHVTVDQALKGAVEFSPSVLVMCRLATWLISHAQEPPNSEQRQSFFFFLYKLIVQALC